MSLVTWNNFGILPSNCLNLATLLGICLVYCISRLTLGALFTGWKQQRRTAKKLKPPSSTWSSQMLICRRNLWSSRRLLKLRYVIRFDDIGRIGETFDLPSWYPSSVHEGLPLAYPTSPGRVSSQHVTLLMTELFFTTRVFNISWSCMKVACVLSSWSLSSVSEIWSCSRSQLFQG